MICQSISSRLNARPTRGKRVKPARSDEGAEYFHLPSALWARGASNASGVMRFSPESADYDDFTLLQYSDSDFPRSRFGPLKFTSPRKNVNSWPLNQARKNTDQEFSISVDLTSQKMKIVGSILGPYQKKWRFENFSDPKFQNFTPIPS